MDGWKHILKTWAFISNMEMKVQKRDSILYEMKATLFTLITCIASSHNSGLFKRGPCISKEACPVENEQVNQVRFDENPQNIPLGFAFPEDKSNPHLRGIESTGPRDDTLWHSIDGPIYMKNDRVAQWILYRRANGVRAPLPKNRHFMRGKKDYDHLIPSLGYFDLKYAPSGNGGWGAVVGPIEMLNTTISSSEAITNTPDVISVHWFRVRKNITDALDLTEADFKSLAKEMLGYRWMMKET